MRDEANSMCGGAPADGRDVDPADRLTALAREARLLEFGLEGDGDAERCIAADLESALATAMEADSADELTLARSTIGSVLSRITSQGMRLSAQMTDMEVDGILGTARMPVLTAVLSAHA